MDLTFYKLHTAGTAWLLIDNSAASLKDGAWDRVARSLCHRLHGAGADGLVVLERSQSDTIVRQWSARGRVGPASPAALLCAARWLFDTGQAEGDSLRLLGTSGYSELIMFDSQAFGLRLLTAADYQPQAGLRRPTRQAGKLAADNYAGTALLDLADGRLAVDVLDGPLRRRPAGSSRSGQRQPETTRVELGVISRQQLTMRCTGIDPLAGAAWSLVVAGAWGFCEPEVAIRHGQADLVAYKAADQSVFVAAPVGYALKGESWQPETGPNDLSPTNP
ncbi:MAG: hypothetical protein A2087_08755 [Spirochaetes bacterium GWD1_61_31]|nr:MAG: hypothetical protein A2Y37_14440 [Spirochaetes bacterium GWB1_60_80]OHD32377.1 MAG: hypothetical protein A2004_06390 [Spirochaetes bacterium GWC1_61_12]OHD38058.1 MAG: hypothetical protein A2087_08755 [Spirochaetes bacterium GWD1_61_31]OHD44544.1 MAG: hypothetical protein A2Y35_05280 [Spirochaetes bacterium GWE1_60_18]OHD58668.1 MAG: hypothetical protein A2Y32_03335 [Spirochaetes bacterium GWF1_60_12]HAP43200.1 hypothetical protein [Spirochaetaceae bacterium]